jgi:geranylgeranyl diphosphate synthase type II
MNIDIEPFNNRLTEVIGTEPPGLISDGMATALSGGKRIRPQVILALGASLQVERKICLDFAVAVELTHTASLILDDLPSMDDSDSRRGQPALHMTSGVGVATLVAFSMLARAFDVLNDTRLDDVATRSQLCLLLARTIGGGGMAEGQARELQENNGSGDPTEIAHLKTATLFSASLAGVGLIAKLDPMTISMVKQLGDSLGLAFQFCDDLHDGDSLADDVLRKGLDEELVNSRQLLKSLPASFHRISFLADWIEESANKTLGDTSDAS